MKFQETNLQGVWLISLDKAMDERGFFARTFCQNEFRDHGLAPSFVQCNLSHNYKRGTLRGMHFQISPHQEAKLVQCTQGAIYDVIIDLRPTSPTYLAYLANVLTTNDHNMLYVPEGFAHGFLTLEDETSIFYQMSAFFTPPAARGLRWNDPIFNIQWPEQPQVISERDNNYADFSTPIFE